MVAKGSIKCSTHSAQLLYMFRNTLSLIVSLLLIPNFLFLLAVTVMFDPTSYTVTEGGSTMATVVLSGSSTRTITVDVASSGGTATGKFITHTISF